MTLRAGDIAQWYEWQTVVCLFGAGFYMLRGREHSVWEPLSHEEVESALRAVPTVRATRLYLQLCRYADRHSPNVDWTQSLRTFFQDKRVGMLLLWPDAIPREYLSTARWEYRFAVPPTPDIIEECWLLTVPAGREDRQGSPSTRALCDLLTAFMAEPAQAAYQSAGGLSVHRGVQNDTRFWEKSLYLPYLQRIRERSTLPRHAHESSWRFAKALVGRLDELRAWVAQEFSGWGRKVDGGYDEVFWYDPESVAKIDKQIECTFTELLGAFTNTERSDVRS